MLIGTSHIFFCLLLLFITLFTFLGKGLSSLVLPSPALLCTLFPVSAVTSLQVHQFALKLSNHPNQPLVSIVLEGTSQGFQVGYFHQNKLKPILRNTPPTNLHLKVADSYLANEVSLGKVGGTFDHPPLLVFTSVALVSPQRRVNQQISVISK